MTLDDTYLANCEARARRFSGAYTGTSGTLAADVMRLLAEVRRLRSVVDSLVGEKPVTQPFDHDPLEYDTHGFYRDRGRTNIAPGD